MKRAHLTCENEHVRAILCTLLLVVVIVSILSFRFSQLFRCLVQIGFRC